MDTEHVLAQTFAENHPSDAAVILERLPPQVITAYLEQIPARSAADILERMAVSTGAECLARLSLERFVLVIEKLSLYIAAVFLRHIDQEGQERLLRQSPADITGLLRRLLHYPEKSAGAMMDPRVLAFPQDITASEALSRVRRAPRHALYYIYVIDRTHKLVGVLNLRELMLASPQALLASVMNRQVIAIGADADRSSIVAHPGWGRVHALPVVDDQGILLGALRYETLRQLEGKSDAGTQTAGAISTVLTLGELYWTALAGILTDLTTATTSAPKAGKEPASG